MLTSLEGRLNERGLYNHGTSILKSDALRDNLAMAQLLIEHVKVFPMDIQRRSGLKNLMDAIVSNFKSDGKAS